MQTKRCQKCGAIFPAADQNCPSCPVVEPHAPASRASAYGDHIGHVERVGYVIAALLEFAAPLAIIFVLFGPLLAGPDGRPLIFALVNWNDQTSRIAVSIFLFAIVFAAWKQAVGLFLTAVRKNAPTLHRAAESDDQKSIKAGVTVGTKIDSRDRFGNTALHVAVFKGNLSSVSALLAAGADVNAKQKNGATPLHLAAFNGHNDIAELLLANNATVSAKDGDGATPLHLAGLTNQKKLAELLLANEAEVNANDNESRTPLHVATLKGHNDIVELLRRCGGHMMGHSQAG
jgi:ankyrin repeat protein